jgi:predicted DCC family thiol-disulfide oxidoreductase YuxK
VLGVVASSLRHGLLPNPVAWLGTAWFATVWCLLGVVLGALLAVGWRRAWVAAALWFVWAAIYNCNPLIANPAIPYVGLILLLFVVIPDGEPWRWRGRECHPSEWAMPWGVFAGIWLLMALGYTFSGLEKLLSPSWQDGTAFAHVLQNPTARLGPLRDFALTLPSWVHALASWGAMAAEILFLPLCLTRNGRKWAWLSLVAMHLGLLAVLDFGSVSAGMLLLHAFTFDPAWLAVRLHTGRHPVLLYDGECGLCNAIVRFLVREDSWNLLRYAPLQGKFGQKALRNTGLPTTDFDSLVYLPDADGTRYQLRTAGVLAVLDGLGGLWRVLSWLSRAVPGPLRDLGYKLVAHLRYRLFGSYQPQPWPDPQWAERFLD